MEDKAIPSEKILEGTKEENKYLRETMCTLCTRPGASSPLNEKLSGCFPLSEARGDPAFLVEAGHSWPCSFLFEAGKSARFMNVTIKL